MAIFGRRHSDVAKINDLMAFAMREKAGEFPWDIHSVRQYLTTHGMFAPSWVEEFLDELLLAYLSVSEHTTTFGDIIVSLGGTYQEES